MAPHERAVTLPSLPVRMLDRRAGTSEPRYRLFLAQIHLHLSDGGERACHRRPKRRGLHPSSSSSFLTWLVHRPRAREQVCGVVCYMSTGTARRGDGGEKCGEPGGGKRKAGHAIDGMITQHELSAWLKDVGGDDVMLEELLSVGLQSTDGECGDCGGSE